MHLEIYTYVVLYLKSMKGTKYLTKLCKESPKIQFHVLDREFHVEENNQYNIIRWWLVVHNVMCMYFIAEAKALAEKAMSDPMGAATQSLDKIKFW